MTRPTIGSLWLWANQKFGHGLRVAWYRDVVRPRILTTSPIVTNTEDCCEIHVLTSKNDWLNLLWTLKSFYLASGRRYALCVHEDGSLDATQIAAFEAHFPKARIIRRRDADKKLRKVLREFPRSYAFREKNVLALKVFDFGAYLQSQRMAVFDSDLLFFREPSVFLERIENGAYKLNTFNADVSEAYTVEEDVVREHFGVRMQPRVNSGLGLIQPESIRLDWVEQFLGLPDILEGHFWRIEQTILALCSSRYGVELLPEEYSVSLVRRRREGCVRHYVGAIRHLMYGEGIRQLVNDKFLERATVRA